LEKNPHSNRWSVGPATFVTAAFIGPGTVTMCVIAGAKYGLSLLWALCFSLLTTLILQSLSAKVAIISRKNLEENILKMVRHKTAKLAMLVLIFSAILVGNSAYQSGNITGAVLGANLIFNIPESEKKLLITSFVSFVAFLILRIENIRLLTKWIFTLVVVMSVCFLVSALAAKPPLSALIKALFLPGINEVDWFVVAGLVGTTIVPYNLFLHSNLAKEKWPNTRDSLKYSFMDTLVAILIGGVISVSIVISSGLLEGKEVHSASDLSMGLESLFGDLSNAIVGVGLFSAGISSAVTAPLAASVIASGLFTHRKSKRLTHNVRYIVLGVGYLIAATGFSSLQLIHFAQVTNALLLPLAAFLLFLISVNKQIMGDHVLKGIPKYLILLVIAVCVLVAIRGLLAVFLS
jgi:manganese transport protein